jgi:pilus assembly protein CpaC
MQEKQQRQNCGLDVYESNWGLYRAARLAALALAGFVLPLTVRAATTLPTQLHLYAGEAKVVASRPIERVAVGNGKLVEVHVLHHREMVIIGDEPGETVLHVWGKDGSQQSVTVDIAPNDTEKVAADVRGLLKDVPGLTINVRGDHVVLTGSGLTTTDMAWIAKVQKLYPQVVTFATPAAVELRDMILMKVRIMEFDKNALNKLGIDWQNAINGPAFGLLGDFYSNGLFRIPQKFQGVQPPLNVDPFKSFLGIATSISSTINLLEQSGKAYQLAAPELSARSGGEANFLVGGEVPLPESSVLGQTTVEFKKYGIQLHIQPVADKHGNILAAIRTEVSRIDPTITVAGIPGFLTREADAELNVKDGQTIAISGLVNAQAARNLNKFPILGDIPILGELFKSHAFRAKRTDLVIFVTPHIVNASSPLNKAALHKSDKLLLQFKNSLGQGIVD